MKVFFVRHGKDDDRYRGGWSELDLTPEGIAQAKCLADYLKEYQWQNNITRILSSDLPRAMTTAGYLSEKLGLEIQKEPRLRETNNGVLAGMRNETALERYPGLFFSTLKMDEAYPGGESPRDFYRRIEKWFTEFCSENHDSKGHILVVTHGGVISVICHLVKGLEWSNKGSSFKPGYCSMYTLNLDTMEFEAENRMPS